MVKQGVSIARLEDLCYSAKLDKQEAQMRSMRGFSRLIKVDSDRPSYHYIWSPGTVISWQRLKADGLTISQRYAFAARCEAGDVRYNGKTYWVDLGSTFEAPKPPKPEPKVYASLMERLFGD